MRPRDLYSQPNAADPVLEERTVLDLVRRHGVSGSAVTSIDETGGEARVYVLDETLVVKVQRPHRLRPRTSLEKEAFFLQQLAAYPDIVVPHVLGYGRHDHHRIPGDDADARRLRAHGRAHRGAPEGRVASAREDPATPPRAAPGAFPWQRALPWGPHAGRRSWRVRRATLAHAVQVIGDTPYLWPLDVTPADLAARVLAALPASVDLVALHSNPGPVHTFVQPDTLRFCRPDRFRRCVHRSSRPRLAVADPRGPCRPAARLR